MGDLLFVSRYSDDILMWSHYANDAHHGFCLEFFNEQGLPFSVEPICQNVEAIYDRDYESLSRVKYSEQVSNR